MHLRHDRVPCRIEKNLTSYRKQLLRQRTEDYGSLYMNHQDQLILLFSLDEAYPRLVNFCSGFANTFPGTSTVESDFSLIALEKDYIELV